MVESSTPTDAAVVAEAGAAEVGVVAAAGVIPACNAAAAVAGVAYTTAAVAVEMCADAAGDAEAGFVVVRCSSHKVT
jgi:hypothetical protein